MKARVKATGEIVEVVITQRVTHTGEQVYMTDDSRLIEESRLEFNADDIPDYWTRLEHQYAGMAMQGMIRRAYEVYCDDCANYENMIFEDAQALLKDHAEALADVCVEFAHALVEKMKEERK